MREPRRPQMLAGPRHRPPAALRITAGLATTVALGFGGLLMMSDRAPGALRAVFGDRAERLWERIDQNGRAEFLTGGGPPEPDTVVHVLVWFTITTLLALTLWRWWGVIATAATMAVLAVVTELAQGRWSSTRAVEVRDVWSDVVGTTLGSAVAVLVMAVWSAVAGVRSSRDGTRASIAPPARR